MPVSTPRQEPRRAPSTTPPELLVPPPPSSMPLKSRHPLSEVSSRQRVKARDAACTTPRPQRRRCGMLRPHLRPVLYHVVGALATDGHGRRGSAETAGRYSDGSRTSGNRSHDRRKASSSRHTVCKVAGAYLSPAPSQTTPGPGPCPPSPTAPTHELLSLRRLPSAR